MLRSFGIWLSLGVMGLLAACGGGGSSGPTQPTLSSISVTPASMSVPAGLTQQFTATGIYSDGSKQDLTSSVSWSSANAKIATISTAGLATALAAGSSTITATTSGVSGNTMLTVTSAALVSISVTPGASSIALGTAQGFTATGLYTDHSSHDVTNMVTWASSTTSVATISSSAGSNGVARSVATGTSQITASLGGISSAAVTLTVTPANLVSIGVTPAAPSIALGTTEQFTAVGIYTNGTSQNLTTAVTWTSSGAAATISNTSGSNGLATSATPGTTQITAKLGGVTSPAVTLTVTPATLVSIGVTPAAPSIARSTTAQFTATGIYTDNSTQNLTAAVTWTSSNTTVATISSAVNSSGLATGASPGTSMITATLGNVTSQAVTLTVTNATLVSIGVTPALPSIAAGTTAQFTATGTYSDNSHQTLTGVTWTSSNTTVATISSAAGTNGLATSLTMGTSQITATLGSVSSPAVTLNVTSATLVSIAVTPATPSIPIGNTQQFTATGTYTDNSQHALTTAVWTSSNTGVATISSPNGLATSPPSGATGTTQITAAVGSITSPAVTLTVTPANLVSIAVTTSTPSIAKGTTAQFTATGTYSDNSTQAVTTATWTSSNTSVATISSAPGTNGVATSAPSGTTGTSQITATVGSITSPPVTLTVTAATLVSIAVTPSPANVVQGLDQHFTATGTYTDNSTQVLTSTVTWSSNTTSVATISNAPNSWGLATGLATGSANITAVLGSVTSPAAVLTVGAGTDTVLYSFSNGADGGNPAAGLIQYSDGNFYGTTSGDAGATSYGTVFKVTPSGQETVLYTFTNGADSGTPDAGLLLASDGNFYGTTLGGNGGGVGTVFQYNPTTNGFSTLYTFGAGADGANVKAGVIQNSTDSNLYGTTQGGGTPFCGTVFKLTLAGQESVIYSFQCGADGAYPVAGLAQDAQGNMYGTTLGDGTNLGTVFKVTTAGVETVLHVFTGVGNDGASPYAGLILGSDGNFYGTTQYGGSANLGTVFRITPSGTLTVLYSFQGSPNDGARPVAGLILGSDGTLYGTTQYGGTTNGGTLFEYTPAGAEAVLYSFTGQPGGTAYADGAGPVGGLTFGSDGSLYGTTIDGGTGTNTTGVPSATGGYGTVFKY